MRYGIPAVAAIVMVAVVFQHGCKDKGTEPVPPKNPREYTWTVDTLIAHPDAIQTWMWDIYGTSPQNVCVVGHTDWTGVNGNGIMWRYDGTRWSIVNQGFRDISLNSITGFGPSNIYAAGSKGSDALILHFNGTSWTQTILPGYGLFAIRGSSPSNIWAGGWGGTVFRFDGAQWIRVSADERLNFKDFAVTNQKTYAIAYRVDEQPQDTIWYYSLSWNGQQWDTLDVWLDLSLYPSAATFGAQSLSIIDSELYSAGGGLFRLELGNWFKVLGNAKVAKVFGTSKNNMLAVGTSGEANHYDGSNWYQFEQFKSNEF
ncbi:MAG TPA: hypothetical protein VNN76_06930, partial [Bacteroidota bacterium]|nr:hypothetical protein [Bacteroidota bacterium]